jgi:hypothetical protein
MSRVPQYMHRVAGWEVTNTGLTANRVEHLETPRVQLEEKMVQFKALTAQHAALTTSKQQVAKEMQALFRERWRPWWPSSEPDCGSTTARTARS